MLAADSASQPLRRNQPASQTATAAESASQPPCCGGISEPAKESASTQSHLMLVNSDHPCRPFLRGGWRNFACAADGGISHRSAADGGISHRSTAAGGIVRSRRTAESATEPRRLAEFRVCGGRRNQPPIRGGWRKSFLRPRCPTYKPPFHTGNKVPQKTYCTRILSCLAKGSIPCNMFFPHLPPMLATLGLFLCNLIFLDFFYPNLA